MDERLAKRLVEINLAMSTYDPESEISRFNEAPTGQWIRISQDFRNVLDAARRLHDLTDGAFDPTMAPLIEAWGFDHEARIESPLSREEVETALKQTGMSGLTTGTDGIRKSTPGLMLNMSAIAKGYAVDQLTDLLTEAGYTNVYVNIGGEIRTTGTNPDEIPWRIGISRPRLGSRTDNEKPYAIVGLDHQAVATSGDYRNFFIKDGTIYSHILDPRTGYPVTNRVASVTVLAPDCMTADALATAFMVMGESQAVELSKSLDRTETMVVERTGPDRFEQHATAGWEASLIPLEDAGY